MAQQTSASKASKAVEAAQVQGAAERLFGHSYIKHMQAVHRVLTRGLSMDAEIVAVAREFTRADNRLPIVQIAHQFTLRNSAVLGEDEWNWHRGEVLLDAREIEAQLSVNTSLSSLSMRAQNYEYNVHRASAPASAAEQRAADADAISSEIGRMRNRYTGEPTTYARRVDQRMHQRAQMRSQLPQQRRR